jgi:RHS repeat-associated protein
VPEYVIKNGETYRIFSDHLGSPRVVVNATTGVVMQRMDFQAFGEIIQDSNPGWQPFGFAGGLYDPDSGLVRFGVRDYEASIGRWTVKDPLGLEAGPNAYEYAADDPLQFVDTSGLDLVVIENGPTEGNPLGHTAIGITGYGVFSYGNGTRLGSSIEAYLVREAPRRNSLVYVIKTTRQQDLAAFRATVKDRGMGVLIDNCSSRSNDILDAAGIPYPTCPSCEFPLVYWPNLPGTAALRAIGAGAQRFVIPKGSSVSASLRERLK